MVIAPWIISVLTLLAGLASVQSHGIMRHPRPYHLDTGNLLQVNPIDGATFPFPCQGRTTEDNAPRTSVTAGDRVFVDFTIGADHHGGSCQFSVTYEDPPSADKSTWRTIFTIIGGCPVNSTLPITENIKALNIDPQGRNAITNCNNDTGENCVRQFNIPFPKDMPNGKATFAWTWFNYVGNREMYMNCAPIEVTNGAGDDHTFFNSLPQMFVANFGSECWTGPKPGDTSVDANQGILNIPNPGRFGKVLENPMLGLSKNPDYTCEKNFDVPKFADADISSNSSDTGASAASPGTSLGALTSSSSSSPPSSSSLPYAVTNLCGSTCSYMKTTTRTTTTSSTSTTTKSSANTSPTTNPIHSSSAGSYGSVTTPPPESTSSQDPGNNPCSHTTDGAWFCVNEKTMGRCDHGIAKEIPVAAGIMCSDGLYVAATST